MTDEPQSTASAIQAPQWQRRLGGLTAFTTTAGPWLAGFLLPKDKIGIPAIVGLVLLAAAAWAWLTICAKVAGIRYREFRDNFPFQAVLYIWNVGTAMTDAAARRRKPVSS